MTKNKVFTWKNIGHTILTWWDNFGLLSLGLFLLAFIPLYPKIPVFSPIEAYIVRVRLEDFLVLGAAIAWLVQWWRGKVKWQNPILVTMAAYFFTGLLSVLLGIFLLETIPLEYVRLGKSALHYFRYIEYFSLCLVLLAGIRSRLHLWWAVIITTITIVALAVYGYGQRYYYWPVYSTMNREFSKGVRLYLTREARVQSTFAGHYDLSAYLVITLPILLAAALLSTNRLSKIGFHIAHWLGLWLLVVAASRTSFIGYLLAVVLVVAVIAWQKSGWLNKIKYAFSRMVLVTLIVGITTLYFGDDIYDRFVQLLEAYPKIHAQYHEFNRQRKELVANNPITHFFQPSTTEPPSNGISTDDATRIILSSDTRPTPIKPSDVYVDVPLEIEVATISATGEQTTVIITKEREYSENALRHGLSLAIRLDALWPQAIAGFMRNPLTGSGYATLNQTSPDIFVEADSTDNNFLRTLGETGALGFVTFYGSILLAIYLSYLLISSKNLIDQIIGTGYFAGNIGLLVNALYIDVYAASKVAFTFWALTGVVLAAVYLNPQASKKAPHLLPKHLAERKSKVQK